MVLSNLLHELVLTYGCPEVVNVETFSFEGFDGFMADVFEDQKFDFDAVYRMERFWRADGVLTGVF